MDCEEIAALREAAASWSLAGDGKLLASLQRLHQKVMDRANQTNNKLDEMLSSLNSASVLLQNVNNRFMALSNSQFVESRVYDDDPEDGTEKKLNEQPVDSQSKVRAEVMAMASGLDTLQRYFEEVRILADSDSDSEDEHAESVVLKAKDLYAERPLPHIIGTPSWRTKWHAGLVLEDSDSGSTVSADADDVEQYSGTGSEKEAAQDSLPINRRHAASLTSDDTCVSDDDTFPTNQNTEPIEADAPLKKQSQSDFAAELARRLAGAGDVTPRDDVIRPRDVIRPHDVTRAPAGHPKHMFSDQLHQGRVTANLFAEEPPPLDACPVSDDDDIFSDLHKHGPSRPDNKESYETDVFDHFGPNDSGIAGDPNRPLFEDVPAPIDNVNNEKRKVENSDNEIDHVKKPAGAISLFGSKKRAEIGAAILNRNQRQSPDDDRPVHRQVKPQTPQPNQIDIFDSLFAKSAAESKGAEIKDDIFDDIDDIFSADIVSVPVKDAGGAKKSIFDDLDDLFADVDDVVKQTTHITPQSSAVKCDTVKDDIFQDDRVDDLFSDVTHDSLKKADVERSGLFADSDEELFAKSVRGDRKYKSVVSEAKVKVSLFDDDDMDDLFGELSKETKSSENERKPIENKAEITSTDSKTIKEAVSQTEQKVKVKKPIEKATNANVNKEKGILSDKQKDGLFNDTNRDLDDDLFKSKSVVEKETSKAVNKDLFDKEKIIEIVKEKPPLFTQDSNNSDDSDDIFRGSDSKHSAYSKPKAKSDEFDDIFQRKDHEISANIEGSSLLNNDKGFTSVMIEEERKPDNTSHEVNAISKIDRNIKDDFDNIFKERKVVSGKNLKEKDTLFDINKDDLTKNSKQDHNMLNDVEDHKESSILSEPDDDIFRKKEVVSTASDMEKPTSLDDKESLIPNKDEVDDIFKDQKTESPNAVKEKSTLFTSKEDASRDSETDNYDNNKQGVIESPSLQTKTESDNEKSTIFSNTQSSKPDTPDFDDIFQNVVTSKENAADKHISTPEDVDFDAIFNEPPAFEKTSECKKSKNINALFDDDSEDEALFFKKNDHLEEKPDEFPIVVNPTPLFGVFHTEPPAIAVDFVKPVKESAVEKDKNLKKTLSDIINVSTIENNEVKDKEADPNIDNTDSVVLRQKNTESRRNIGRIQSMINVNVSALLPGASPKKLPRKTEPDAIQDQPQTTDEKPLNRLVKSASFEAEPASPVLCNKLSKDRPKIQVKRRPSTRKARHDAVKKLNTGTDGDATDSINKDIDIDVSGDTISDQSSPEFGEVQTKDEITGIRTLGKVYSDEINTDKRMIDKDYVPAATVKAQSRIINDEDLSDNAQVKQQFKDNDPILKSHNIAKQQLKIVDDDESDDLFKTPQASDTKRNTIDKSQTIDTINNEEFDVDDEDSDDLFKVPYRVDTKRIINSESVNVKNKNNEPQTVSNINTIDDDDLFKNTQKSNQQTVSVTKETESLFKDTTFDAKSKTKIKTAQIADDEFTIKNNKQTTMETDSIFMRAPDLIKDEAKPSKTNSKSLFDESSDDETLFGAKSSKHSNSKRSDDLFTKNGKTEITKKVQKDSEKNAFNDKDNGDDLFSKTTKIKDKSEATRQVKVHSMPSKAFNDPLSMLGSDDES